MRVFVLNTGRCGSTTFSEACAHITNFTSGHETRASLYGARRLGFPDQHIEVDNRLSWFLGLLQDEVRPDDQFIWLRRDREAVARSYLARWDYTYRGGIIEAFAHALVMRGGDWSEDKKLDICRFYVDTVEANIGLFLTGRDYLTVRLETARDDFARFWDHVEAEGDREAALDEWGTKYASTEIETERRQNRD